MIKKLNTQFLALLIFDLLHFCALFHQFACACMYVLFFLQETGHDVPMLLACNCFLYGL